MDFVRRLLLALTLTVAATVAPAAAQIDSTHPDLTGVWNLDLGKSHIPQQPKRFAQTVTMSCSGLNIAMRTTTDGKELASTYIADGRKHVVDRGSGLRVETKAYWKKSVLVIEQHANFAIVHPGAGGGPFAVLSSNLLPASTFTVDHWTLSTDGLTLTNKIESSSDAAGFLPEADSGLATLGASRLVFVYDKQP